MNDKEIRLKVLSMLYTNEREGKPAPGTVNDLDGLTLEDYRWASYYLIKHNLVEGHIDHAGGRALAWADHISGKGIDIVENLIEKSVQQAEERKISLTSRSLSYSQQFLELLVIWSKNTDLLNQAWDYLQQLIS